MRILEPSYPYYHHFKANSRNFTIVLPMASNTNSWIWSPASPYHSYEEFQRCENYRSFSPEELWEAANEVSTRLQRQDTQLTD